ncbi:methylmalonyl Co-A mutase-associated GTPase MeaB [Hymenobacter sp. BT770]|uniref:methylmalonyl Co-A mutase-associated GTPase MeaB n=1 Tax=Hymenobacter sp. BT770 TaxID=2886942 RepID=UPI001D12EB7F|nr:methylmalonyl Co-A mutase-associated GTPase MeaB [Hymenobacter sp. BT770]MCC3152908.1 methylmalonyl Co-A mutase-associated GTPase MeaB [Hymenobacter sp. BT770]MDO3414983.1 methylmalonyl Co-A mutase-associated GTPase MeaB [Hymenobacter sp. BT770]
MPPKRLSATEYAEGILAGNRTVLGRAITLAESTLPTDQALTQDVLQAVLPHTGRCLRVGITGVPGVGKSTFIEALGRYLVETLGKKLAVLAVDPSSQRGGGSILGDKTRMPWLAAHPAAFIRPSPAGGSLGGVARATREALLLCEAAGHDVIFVETVGVGQSETTVHGMVDFFLLLLLAGAGDELQGLKRGIMEMADAVCITKADHGNEQAARRARVDYQNALHLFPPAPSGQPQPVLLTSAVSGTGLAEVWEAIEHYAAATRQSGYFQQRRQQQQLQWLHQSIVQELEMRFYADGAVRARLPAIKQAVAAGRLTPFAAATELLGLAGGVTKTP